MELQNIEKTNSWTGEVIRINNIIDQASQTIQVFIKIRGDNLREGMYVEASLQTGFEENCFEVNRNLLIDENKIFLIQEGELILKEIQSVHFKKNTVIIKGLENGALILAKPIANAHQGMQVKVINN